MKKKLAVAFTLIALSLIGIIVFQGYWTVNAYRVNKKQFDNDIDSAMLRAMDSCKRDYFDSIRVVMIKRLSDTTPMRRVRIDTVVNINDHTNVYEVRFGPKVMAMDNQGRLTPAGTPTPNSPAQKTLPQLTAVRPLSQLFAKKPMGAASPPNELINTEAQPAVYTYTERTLAFYKHKIPGNDKQGIPALIIETSFYEPALLQRLLLSFGMADMYLQSKEFMAYIKGHPEMPRDSLFKNHPFHFSKGMYQLPPNSQSSDSTRINGYLKTELLKANIYSPFYLTFSKTSNRVKNFNAWRSETNEFPYKYHGFVFLEHGISDVSYIKAVFKSPQYMVMKSMLLNLLSSVLLIALTGFCFLYVYRTIVEQKKLAELKDDFINNMTHELKTPIATISVAIEGLQNFNALNDPEKTRRYLETSREQLNRLNQLVTKVLNIAAFEGKEVDLAIAPVKVDELVNDIIRSEKAKAGKIVTFSYLNKDNIESVNADAFHLRNVLHNLVDNAVKYSGEAVDIAIMVYREGGMACISVKDNGIGIAPADLAQVFDKFYRVPTGNVHNVKGTGLGLSYSKYIIEAHGGSVNVTSEAGKGSEFIIALPLS